MPHTDPVPPELAGITPAILDELYDLVAAYGIDARGVPLRRLSLHEPKEMHVTVTVPPSTLRSIMVSPWLGGLRPLECAVVLTGPPPHSVVWWHRSFTVADVIAFIASIDAEMKDFRDASGRRMRKICDRLGTARLEVDKVLGDGKVAVFDGPWDPEDLRAQFDRPDEVEVIGRLGSGVSVRKRLHRPDADDVIARVLARKGIRSQADIEGMSRAELAALLDEVNAEIDKD